MITTHRVADGLAPTGAAAPPPTRRRTRLRWLAVCVSLVAFASVLIVIPSRWMRGAANAFWRPDSAAVSQLARSIVDVVNRRWQRRDYRTGSPRFNGEWLLFTYLSAGLGFAQLASAVPARRTEYANHLSACISAMLTDRVRAFHVEAWGEDPIRGLQTNRDHGAYLLYVNLLLNLHTLLDPKSPYASLNEKISPALLQRWRCLGCLPPVAGDPHFSRVARSAMRCSSLFSRRSLPARSSGGAKSERIPVAVLVDCADNSERGRSRATAPVGDPQHRGGRTRQRSAQQRADPLVGGPGRAAAGDRACAVAALCRQRDAHFGSAQTVATCRRKLR